MSEDGPSPISTTVLERAWELYEQTDSGQACEFIESTGDSLTAARTFSDIVPWLYRRKQLPAMIALGRAGIQFSLSEARGLKESDEEQSAQLTGIAKTIAYNVSSNLWPGWNDEGIEPTPSDLAAGLDLARVNLRLGRELNRGPEAIGNGLWLVGAHELAAGHFQKSHSHFDAAAEAFTEAGKADFIFMAEGYAALAGKAERIADADRRLCEILERLRKSGTDDAAFFADQIETAGRVLLKSQ